MFEPIRDFILVERLTVEEEVLESGIIIPGQEQAQKLPQGKVVAVSAELEEVLTVNEVIVYKGWNSLRLGANLYDLVKYDDVFGIVTKDH